MSLSSPKYMVRKARSTFGFGTFYTEKEKTSNSGGEFLTQLKA